MDRKYRQASPPSGETVASALIPGSDGSNAVCILKSSYTLPMVNNSGAALLCAAMFTAASAATSPSPPPGFRGWSSQIAETISAHEYGFLAAADGAWSAFNRANGLRVTVGTAGVELRRDEFVQHDWTLGLRLRRFGRPGDLRRAGKPRVVAAHNRVELQRGMFTEWYVNTAAGIEQGFDFHERPPGKQTHDPLLLEMATSGALAPRPGPGPGAIDFVDPALDAQVRYAGLKVTDVQGRELPSSLSVTGRRLLLRVDDRNAEYPLSVDPLMTSPSWSYEANRQSASLGWSAASAGDVNGDGFDDLVVGAYTHSGTAGKLGKAFLFLGGRDGPALTPAWTGEGAAGGTYFGTSVAGAGDVNNDGYDDVIIGEPNYWSQETSYIGRAHVYLGNSGGLGASPIWSTFGRSISGSYGWSVSGAGDVNGDGYDDVIVGEYVHREAGQIRNGRAAVFHGGPGGPSSTESWVAVGANQGQLGHSVASAGDVNNDGFADVIIGGVGDYAGLTSNGTAVLYIGSPNGLETAPRWSVRGSETSQFLGYAVASAGDVDGDDLDEIVIEGSQRNGTVLIFKGAAPAPITTPRWTLTSPTGSRIFGYSVASAGDVDRDGFADLIVGDPLTSVGGSAYLFPGSASGPPQSPSWEGPAEVQNSRLGWSVSTAGDVNGDGAGDIIAGAPNYSTDTTQTGEGKVYVYLDPIDLEILDPACSSAVICSGEHLEKDGSTGQVRFKQQPNDLLQPRVTRTGVVADGTTRLLLRMKSDQPVTFALTGTDGSPPPADGALGTLSDRFGGSPGDSITLDPEATDLGEYVFASYTAPADFPGLPDELKAGVRIKILASSPVGASEAMVTILSPPTVLVHGLWSDRTAWGGLAQHLRALGHNVCNRCVVDYGSIQPAASFDPRAQSPADQFALKLLLGAVNAAQSQLRKRGVAVSQVDGVGHSMGGLVLRAGRQFIDRSGGFLPAYGRGAFRKIITVGTPHEGSPLADWLIAHKCTKLGIGPFRGGHTLESYFERNKEPFAPALYQLQTSSLAIRNIGRSESVHRVVGVAPETSRSEKALDTVIYLAGDDKDVDHLLDPLGLSDHDTIVPGVSQEGGSSNPTRLSDLVHAAILGDSTETETNSTRVWERVEELLRASMNDLQLLFSDVAPFSPPGAPIGNEPCPAESSAAASEADGAILTLTPAPGTIVQPGQSVSVQFSISGGSPVQGALFGIDGHLEAVEGPGPFALQVIAPQGRSGRFDILADAYGENVWYSAETHLIVQPAQEPVFIYPVPAAFDFFEIGELSQVSVVGRYADGTEVGLTSAPSTSYRTASNGSGVVSVGVGGIIQVHGEGVETIIIEHLGKSATLPVRVRISNLKPFFETLADVTMDAGTALDVAVAAHDPDGNLTALDAPVPPVIATFADLGGGRGEVRLRPGVNEVGVHEVFIVATDRGQPPMNAATTLKVTVRPGCPFLSPPAGSPVVGFDASDAVSWAAMADATAYDAVSGSIAALRANGGDFSQATMQCLGNDVTETLMPFSYSPGPGEALWILVRGVNCVGIGTYDDPMPGAQAVPRDIGIAASAFSCP